MADIGNDTVWSQTDANNNSGTMPSWNGAAAPSTIDDAGRAEMGALKRDWAQGNPTLISAGVANAQTLTYAVAPAALYNGLTFEFYAVLANTGPMTLNVNAIGVKDIKKYNNTFWVDLASGDIEINAHVKVSYYTAGGFFRLMSVTRTANDLGSVTVTDATTNVVSVLDTINHKSTAVVLAGFGSGWAFNKMQNNSGTLTDASKFNTEWLAAGAGVESSKITAFSRIAGVFAAAWYWAEGIVVGAPAGGDKGAGTINVTDYYREGKKVGGWAPISTITFAADAVGSAINLSGYRALRLTFINMKPATDDVRLIIRLSSDNGASYLTTNYDVTIANLLGASAAADATTGFPLEDQATPGTDTGNVATDGGLSGQVFLYNFNQAQNTTCIGSYVFGNTTGARRSMNISGWHTSQIAMDAVRVLFSTGNITSGFLHIEGLPG